MSETIPVIDKSRYDKADEEKLKLKLEPGLTRETVIKISKSKNEPKWMLKKRLQAFELYEKMPMPAWGPDLSKLDLDKITYFALPDAQHNAQSWDDVPEGIKNTFDRLGIPEAEQKMLSGVGAQYDSQVVYHNLKEEWSSKGVIFEDMDVALQKYPEIVKEHFMKCVPASLHKFAALHGAVWSGGTFIHIPKGVKVDIPMQAYFRMNAKKMGQFEHTLIIVEEGAEIHYIEGCFTKGNLVTCNPDYMPIEKIRRDEKVLTSEGVYKRTKEVRMLPYTGDIYTLELYGDSTQKIEVTPEHPFLYVHRQKHNEKNIAFNPEWNIPRYFRKGDYLVVPINKHIKTRKFHEFEVEIGKGRHGFKKVKRKVPLTNEFFRLLGYYLAEGSISKDSYLNFSFNIKERKHIDDVKHCLRKVFGIKKILEMPYEKHNGLSVVVCSVELARIFKQLGNRSDKKVLLPWMMYETREHQREIIRGWYRGDGNYFKKVSETSGWLKELFRINTTSEKLVRQGRDILLRLGIVAFINRRERSREGRKPMYTLGVTGAYLVPFGELVQVKVKHRLNGRQRASMFGINEKFAFLPIKKITRRAVTNLPVFNFAVADHETYTVGGVAVHNCSAPLHSSASLHAGCVEIFVKERAKARYSSVENWSKNTYNLNTKRALVRKDAVIEWVGGNLGSNVSMLYPCSVLMEERARADHIGIAFAGKDQNQDVGAKVIHLAPRTSSVIKSKSISKDGGITTYRGIVKLSKKAKNSKVNVQCDALMADNRSKSDTIPYMEINAPANVCHEATCGKISDEQIFYLMSRGLTEEQAIQMIVSGFIESFVKELPMEYAVELNMLIEMEMEGSLG